MKKARRQVTSRRLNPYCLCSGLKLLEPEREKRRVLPGGSTMFLFQIRKAVIQLHSRVEKVLKSSVF